MSVKPEVLEKIIESLIADLGEGLIATDIWFTGDLESLAYIHGKESSPELIGFINNITGKIDETLKDENLAGIGNYLIKLVNNNLLVVMTIDIYHQHILLDLDKTPIGILMNVALPNLSKHWSEAVKKPRLSAFLQKLTNKSPLGKLKIQGIYGY